MLIKLIKVEALYSKLCLDKDNTPTFEVDKSYIRRAYVSLYRECSFAKSSMLMWKRDNDSIAFSKSYNKVQRGLP